MIKKITSITFILIFLLVSSGCGVIDVADDDLDGDGNLQDGVVNTIKIRDELVSLNDAFDVEYENSNGISFNKFLEVGDILSDGLVLVSNLTIRSKLIFSESQNYLYVNSSGSTITEYGSTHTYTEVEFKEEDGVFWMLEAYNLGFYTLKLDSLDNTEEYLNLFLYESSLILTDDVVVKKIDDSTFDVTVTRNEIENFEALENFYDDFNFDNFSEFKIRYIFGDNTLEMDFFLTGIKVEGNRSSIDYHFNSIVELVDIVEKENIEPGNYCYMMNTSIEDTLITFSPDENLKICHKEGANYLAVHLQPGLYSFAEDFTSNMPDKVVNDQGETIYEPSGTVIGELLQIDEEQTVYIIENHYSTGYPRTLRLEKMYISIEILNDLPLESGLITSTIESEDDYSYYSFEPSEKEKIMFVTITEVTIPIYDSTRVYISGNTGGCNIKDCTLEPFYVQKNLPFKLITRGNRNGTFTFEYYTVDTGVLSHNINEPADIETYSENAYAVSSTLNDNIYISFEVTEKNDYLVVNGNVISTNDYLIMNLYDSNGNLLIQSWDSYQELELGVYIVEYVPAYNVIFVPVLEANTSN